MLSRRSVLLGATLIWAECLAKSLNQIAVHDDELAWIEFFMLAKVVLRVVNQRGAIGFLGRRRT